jgi:hypothetical protein
MTADRTVNLYKSLAVGCSHEVGGGGGINS